MEKFPGRILIRPATTEDAAGIAHTRVDTWRTTYRGLMPDTILDELNYLQATESVLKGLEKSAELGWLNLAALTETGEVVGMSMCGPERSGDADFKGEIYGLYVLQRYQHVGIGRELVLEDVRFLIGNGFKSMLIWVLTDNHQGCAFYEAIGGKDARTQQQCIHGTMLEETGYGWSNLEEWLLLQTQSPNRGK